MLKPFVPVFFGGKNGEDGKTVISMENLLREATDPAFMDVKMGTETVTMNTRQKGEKEIQRRLDKDARTTSLELGYTCVGYKVKTASGEFEKGVKCNTPKDELLDLFKKVFWTQGVDGEIDRAGLDSIKEQLREILAHFQNVNEHEIRGSSLFFVVSPQTAFYTVKLIDLNSVRPLSEVEGYDGERDQGMITGFTNLLNDLEQL